MDYTIDCKFVEEKGLATSYLAGELDPSQAEIFEQHYLGCERCWSEVRTASELRASLGRPAVVPLERRSDRSTWSLLAAAAILAVAALGAWQLAHRSSSSLTPPVLRGAAENLLPVKAVRLADGQIQVAWTSHDEAQTYRVEILRSDGVPVWKRETGQTSMTFDSTTLPALPGGVSFVARVEALNPTGQVVATSGSVRLPTH